MKAATLAALVLFAATAAHADPPKNSKPRASRAAAQNASASSSIADVRKAAQRIRGLHRKMAAPVPGEWLFEHHEDGQTFDQYQSARPAGLGTDRRTIYLAPLGRHTAEQARVMHDTGEFLAIFFAMKIEWLDPISEDVIPPSARRVNRHTKETQFDSIHIIQRVLPKRVPGDAAALLALTATDLWPGNDWNYVFGQGSLGFPTGVWSMNRLGNAAIESERNLVLHRMIKIATHETGHLFGVPHCTAYECGMNGSNSLAETDRHPLAFCPECEAKLWFVSGADPFARYRKLADFARRHGFKQEEQLWNASAEALEDSAR
jgi:archaemetzincin